MTMFRPLGHGQSLARTTSGPVAAEQPGKKAVAPAR